MSSDVPNDVTVYAAEEDFGQPGRAYLDAEADRGTIVRNFISGQYKSALRVIAFNTAEGWSRDVSEDIANDVSIVPTMPTRRSPKGPGALSTGT